MSDRLTPYNVLFLCTGNSARSLLAEAYLNSLPGTSFQAFSAGSQPTGAPNETALETLKTAKISVDGLRSKSWDEFAADDAPQMDFIFTVCGNAANETCPVWPGHPVSAHWGVDDPAAVTGTDAEKQLAFADAYRMLNQRVSIFASLPLANLDAASLRERLVEIGKS